MAKNKDLDPQDRIVAENLADQLAAAVIPRTWLCAPAAIIKNLREISVLHQMLSNKVSLQEM
jgi:hypothetical protein